MSEQEENVESEKLAEDIRQIKEMGSAGILADSFRRSLFPVKGLHQEARMFPDQFSGT